MILDLGSFQDETKKVNIEGSQGSESDMKTCKADLRKGGQTWETHAALNISVQWLPAFCQLLTPSFVSILEDSEAVTAWQQSEWDRNGLTINKDSSMEYPR